MITLQREPVLVGAIVARAVETARPAIDASRHELVIELPDEPLRVDGDRTRLVQVVGNLLHNAAKFTEPGGRISLRVARDGGSRRASASRTRASASPPSIVPTIFDLFTQVHAGRRTPQGGLGIGLALVRRLVEMHGGTVAAHSDGPGRGTEFTRAPAAAGRARCRPTRRPGSRSRRRPLPPMPARRILVADDNHDAAESLALLLELAGHDVRTAHDGARGARRRRRRSSRRSSCSTSACRRWTATRPRGTSAGSRGASDATLIALTGWGQQQDRQRTAEAGFDAHLVKPVSEPDLFRAIAASEAAPVTPTSAN